MTRRPGRAQELSPLRRRRLTWHDPLKNAVYAIPFWDAARHLSNANGNPFENLKTWPEGVVERACAR